MTAGYSAADTARPALFFFRWGNDLRKGRENRGPSPDLHAIPVPLSSSSFSQRRRLRPCLSPPALSLSGVAFAPALSLSGVAFSSSFPQRRRSPPALSLSSVAFQPLPSSPPHGSLGAVLGGSVLPCQLPSDRLGGSQRRRLRLCLSPPALSLSGVAFSSSFPQRRRSLLQLFLSAAWARCSWEARSHAISLRTGLGASGPSTLGEAAISGLSRPSDTAGDFFNRLPS